MHSTNQFFLRKCGFFQVLNNLRTLESQNFIKIVRAVLKIMAKNTREGPKIGVSLILGGQKL